MTDYATTEAHVLFLTDTLSVKEQIHLAAMLLDNASARLTDDKRTRRMVETLSADVQKLEGEVRG
jgi:hypothetical protein